MREMLFVAAAVLIPAGLTYMGFVSGHDRVVRETTWIAKPPERTERHAHTATDAARQRLEARPGRQDS